MKGSGLGSPIDTKLQVIELSLIPPNSQGIMPAGVQRFPFEFPIPTCLPTSVDIENRLKIFYQMRATLQRSGSSKEQEKNWIEWARNTTSKKKHVAISPMRIVRAMSDIVSNGLNNDNNQPPDQALGTRNSSDSLTSIVSRNSGGLTATVTQLPWNRRGLDEYQHNLDEQHDLLAFSLAGRSSGNLSQPIQDLAHVQGIRYKIGIDRTAIALGTSIGVEIMIEPTFDNAVVRSIMLNVLESRKYSMKVPAGHVYGLKTPETKKFNEGVKVALKWAFGYHLEDEEEESLVYHENSKKKAKSSKKGEKYVRQRIANSQYLAYFDPPQPGLPSSKSFLNSTIENVNHAKQDINYDSQKNSVHEVGSSSSSSNNEEREVINLKELNQPVRLGEYFGGRFVMPVPDCCGLLHPSMDYESIKLSHWLQLVVTIECNGKLFDLTLDTPGRILDCRYVHDDECETILPPPPSYQDGDERFYSENNWATSTFWEQREPITLTNGWGTCVPCPCEAKRLKAKKGVKANNTSNNHNRLNNISIAPQDDSRRTPPEHLPEWGPPPCYTEN